MTEHASESTLARLKRDYGRKGGRFVIVSAFNVLFGQTLLVVTKTGFGLTEVWANVAAVCLSAVPAYLLTRYWAWEKRGKNHFMKEVVPFWTMAFVGLGFSTLLAWFAQRYSTANDLDDLQAQVLLNLANLFAFGIVWIGKFFILDRVLFAKDHFTGESHQTSGSGERIESST